LFLLVIDVTPDKVMPELVQYGGTVYQTSLSKEAESNFQKALENKDVSEAAGEMLDLEDELERLANLKEQGIITEEEFEAKKKKMLGI
jgi:predicted Zn-dependent peptidase